MKKEKLMNVIEGILIVILGILIAIFGGGSVLDMYFAIVSLVCGIALLLIAIISLINNKILPFGHTVLGGALIAISIGLFIHYLTFAQLITLLVFFLLGAGAALILYSIYVLVRIGTPQGVSFLILGIALLTITILYLAVPDFRKAFWIIVGIIVALYGLLFVSMQFVKTKKK